MVSWAMNFFLKIYCNFIKTWEGIQEIVDFTEKETKDINCIQVLNETITNPTVIASRLNNHFSSKAKKNRKQINKI